jgi:hypothetical protein
MSFDVNIRAIFSWPHPQVKELHSFNQFYSMILAIKLSEYFCEISTGKNRVGNTQRKRERGKNVAN